MFFDIHCHILYGIDDGPDNPSGMFEMIKTAYFYGVRKIIVTPHHNPMLFKYSPETESKVFSELLDYSAVSFPDLKICPFLWLKKTLRLLNFCRTLTSGLYMNL